MANSRMSISLLSEILPVAPDDPNHHKGQLWTLKEVTGGYEVVRSQVSLRVHDGRYNFFAKYGWSVVLDHIEPDKQVDPTVERYLTDSFLSCEEALAEALIRVTTVDTKPVGV